MADNYYDKTSLGDRAKNRSISVPLKGDIDIFPQQLTLRCGTFEIKSDGTAAGSCVFIDGKLARGIYSLKLNLNPQRLTRLELGVFLDEFNFDVKPRDQGENNGKR